MRIAILILNYNGLSDTLECLASLKECGWLHSTIVIDNGSSQGDALAIESAYPEARVLALPKNVGFAGGFNRAFDVLHGQGLDAYVLLNNDTTVLPGAIEGLINSLRTLENAALVGPRILQYYSPERNWLGAGQANMWLGIFRYTNKNTPIQLLNSGTIECDFVSGCAFIVRSTAITAANGFRESYFCYYEDIELCLRLRKLGYKIYLDNRPTIYHKEGRTSGPPLKPFTVYHTTRNLIWLMKEHATTAQALTFSVVLALLIVPKKMTHALLHREWKSVGSVLRGFLDGLILQFDSPNQGH